MDEDLGNISCNTDFIIKSMEQKSLLITGVTGFLAKVFMEKVLRIQPQVKRIYLLLRAEDTTSATHRFQQEVIGKNVFSVLREVHGSSKGFESFISSKVVCLAGDISLENLGITPYSDMEQEMLKEINFIVNVAANCNYEERYDVALRVNTFGVKHVFEFAKKCRNLESFLHVSTAYVTREKEGRILEKLPLRKGDMFSESSLVKQDIEMELRIVEERLKQLIEESTDKTTTVSMKALGLQRARFHGWVNTYVFTKAMGEILLYGLFRENNFAVPVVILRPTDITSTYKQPFPGWNEDSKGIDIVADAYGKGNLTHFLANPHSVMDMIPGDMVVNAMMVALVASHEDNIIYQVGSSVRNPVKCQDIMSWASDYYSMNPYLHSNVKPIRMPRLILLPSMASYSEFVTKHYKEPLEALQAGNALSMKGYFQDMYHKLNKQFMTLTKLVELFGPFSLFKGRFDNSNAEKLRAMVIGEEEFDFDAKVIDWEDYFKNVHFPSITKYAISKSRTLQATPSRL